jgi:hypothetical protein
LDDYPVTDGKGKKGGRGIRRRTADDRFGESIQDVKDRTAALKEEQAALGQSFFEQQRRSVAFDLEQEALRQVREEAQRKGDQDWQNAKLSPEQVRAIDEVSEAYARQADELRKAQDALDLQRDVLKGAFSDFRSALEDGKLDWEDFSSIAINALDKVIDKIEDDLIDAIMQVGGASGGGGFLDTIFGGIGKLFGGGGGTSWAAANAGFASGTANTGGQRGQPRGVVHGQEAVIPLPNGGKVPVQLSMPQMPTLVAGNTSHAATYRDNRVYHIDARGAQQGVGAEIQKALAAYDRQMPDRVKQISNDPRAR